MGAQLIRKCVRWTSGNVVDLVKVYKQAACLLVALSLVTLAVGCTPRTQSAPLKVALRSFGAPGGFHPAAPAGLELLQCEVGVRTPLDATVTVEYMRGELRLLSNGRDVSGNWEGGGTGSTAVAPDASTLPTSTTALPPGTNIYVSRIFAVRPGLRKLTVVYRVPGYPESSWSVR